MLGAHGLGFHLDPQPCGYFPDGKIVLHPCRKWRVHSPLLQQPWERSLCGRCCEPRNEHNNYFHSSWFIPFKTCDVIDSLPHASCIVDVELFFNFVFILSFGGFDGFPEIVTGLFSIVSVSGFKGRYPR